MTSETVWVHCAEADGSQSVVGRLVRSRETGSRPVGTFAYARSWVEGGRGFPLDPERMPLVRGEFATERRAGIHGPLSDALPDRWGRRVIEAQNPGRTFTDPELLLLTGEGAVGRLRFSGSPQPSAVPGAALDLTRLDDVATAFDGIERGAEADASLTALYEAGRSLGGARPKTAVFHDGAHWIAKLQRKDDEFDHCAVEDATMRLAGLCGVAVAETRLVDVGPRRALLVRRFDRDGAIPSAHYLSALSALDLDETSHGGGYPDLAGYLRRHGAAAQADAAELFRRMVFNVLAGNRDDHLKNHAFLTGDGTGLRLSPAFDVVPQPGVDATQAISVGRLGGMPNVSNVVSRCGEFSLSADEARAEVERMSVVMAGWRDLFHRWGVDEASVRKLDRSFSPEIGKLAAPHSGKATVSEP